MPIACQYRCEHENIAREQFIESYRKTHDTFLSLNQDSFYTHHTLFFGATPDEIVNCSCCGPKVLEIKCPFWCKDQSFEVQQAKGHFVQRKKMVVLS